MIAIPRTVIRDAYGFVVRLHKPRHRLCRCPQPCQRTFACRAKGHRGSRSTPWCCGGDGESCNECWCKADAKKGRTV